MEYGLIGKVLKHSFSKEIHEGLYHNSYELRELRPEDLPLFFKKRDFLGINVTIPYKQEVFKYLDEVSPEASAIGAVNTIVNENGKLYGYNTDILGLLDLIKKNHIEIENKKVLILGTGGTSHTARYAMEVLHAGQVLVVSRNPKDGQISYAEALQEKDTEVIINTTPVGMFPNNQDLSFDISNFPHLEACIDVIYNPLLTSFLVDAKILGLKYASGLYMLVSQAVYAAEYFHHEKIDLKVTDTIYQGLRKQKQNLVLIGMPSSGKTTIGKMLSEKLNKEFFDTDEEITKKIKMTPQDIIEQEGEDSFRIKETEVCLELAKKQGAIICTGGGVILKEENICALKQNGLLIFIDRPLELLTPTTDRPLSSNKEMLEKRFKERYHLYLKYQDLTIKNDQTLDEVLNKIIQGVNNL